MGSDEKTAKAFASSWNHLPKGSVYTYAQFEDWMRPIKKRDVERKNVLELGCGNGSLLVHMMEWMPEKLIGVDLGDSVISAEENLSEYSAVSIFKTDLITFRSEILFDLVYCIGVLHHLQNPEKGFESVLKNTKPGGKFHCWVYAKEGNWIIIHFVEPLRKIASRLPWWFTKYLLAAPLMLPFYLYAKLLSKLPKWNFLKSFPLYDYALWISEREFAFFHHVAFDQLVTPQTTYVSKKMIESWLENNKQINENTTYIELRNGNSWRFGGTLKLYV